MSQDCARFGKRICDDEKTHRRQLVEEVEGFECFPFNTLPALVFVDVSISTRGNGQRTNDALLRQLATVLHPKSQACAWHSSCEEPRDLLCMDTTPRQGTSPSRIPTALHVPWGLEGGGIFVTDGAITLEEQKRFANITSVPFTNRPLCCMLVAPLCPSTRVSGLNISTLLGLFALATNCILLVVDSNSFRDEGCCFVLAGKGDLERPGVPPIDADAELRQFPEVHVAEVLRIPVCARMRE